MREVQPTPTERRLQEIVAVALKTAPEKVPLDQSLLQGIGLDSFELMQLILQIEEAFQPVSIADKNAQDLQTLRELAAFIDAERQKKL